MENGFQQARTLIVFEGSSCKWAFDAMQVRSMQREDEWRGDAPLDLDSQLGVSSDPVGRSDRRVLVLETEDDEEVPVSVHGPISIETVPYDSVIPPAADSDSGVAADMVQGVVGAGEARTFVLEPRSLKHH